MKIVHAATKAAAPEQIAEHLKAPDVIEMDNGVTVTATEIVYRRYARRFYLTFDELFWAYRQVAQSHVTLGCCGGVLQEFRVVMRTKAGDSVMVNFDREVNALKLMELIQTRNPDCAIGFTKENKARFGVK